MTIEFETVSGLPEATRGGGLAAGPYNDAMRAMKPPTGKKGDRKYQTFFVAVHPNENLSEGERAKDVRDRCRKLSNSFSGIARRIVKTDPAYKFAFRTQRQNPDDENSAVGVRVYRIAADE